MGFKKFCCLVVLALMACAPVSFVSCSDDEIIKPEENIKMGEYTITVSQTGEIEKYDLVYVITAECQDYQGVHDMNGNNLGMVYALSDSEVTRPVFTYKTNKKGYSIGGNLSFRPKEGVEEIIVPLVINVTITFNGKVIGERTFSEPKIMNMVNSFDF